MTTILGGREEREGRGGRGKSGAGEGLTGCGVFEIQGTVLSSLQSLKPTYTVGGSCGLQAETFVCIRSREPEARKPRTHTILKFRNPDNNPMPPENLSLGLEWASTP